MLVGIAFWIMADGGGEGYNFLLHMIMSGVHGLIPVGAATVYDIESWGITKSTVVHASITLATIVCIEIPMKWWSTAAEFAVAIAIYVVIYTIIWLVNYLYWKNTVKHMNEQLEKIHTQAGKADI